MESVELSSIEVFTCPERRKLQTETKHRKSHASARLRCFVGGEAKVEQQGDSVGPNTSPIEPGGFCRLLMRRRGPVHHQVRILNNDLHDLQEVIMSDQMLAQQPSISLSEALDLHALSDDGKLRLAYSIAYAVWTYYGTELMRTRWTSDEVLFFAEQLDHRSPEVHFRSTHPFVALQFDRDCSRKHPVETEFLPGEGLVHWAPRVFAIGVVLVSIFNNEHLRDRHDETNWQESFNNLAFHCKRVLSDPAWPMLDIKAGLVRKTIREVVAACLNGEIFNKQEVSVAERKATIYRCIVWPLEHLVDITETRESSAVWVSKEQTRPDVPVSTTVTPASIVGTTLSRNAGYGHQSAVCVHSLTDNSSGPEGWVTRLTASQLNFDLQAFYKKNRSSRRTRIAILDTGYNSESMFFAHAHRRKRIKECKDLSLIHI